MNKRTLSSLTALVALLLAPSLTVSAEVKEATHEVEVRTDVKIPMRDGVELSANIFLPKAEGKFPVLLMLTPYGKGDEKNGNGHYYASHGYAVVLQDCRGTGQSDGKWVPFLNETPDGHDTHLWILDQPWCNRRMGTFGGSYVGFTQWMGAVRAGPYLKAMFPVVPLVDPYGDAVYFSDSGAFNLSLSMGWGGLVSFQKGEKVPEIDWEKAFQVLPLMEWDTKVTGRKIPYLRDWLQHNTFDEYWKKGSVRGKWHEIRAPMLNIGGWYDIFSKTVLEHTQKVRTTSMARPMRNHQHVIIGPWTHGISHDGKVGDMDFGKDAVIDLREWQTRWFDCWLKGKDTGVKELPPYRIFVMGKNEWKDIDNWPPKNAQYTLFYFHSDGSANTLDGDGTLSTQRPGEQAPDKFTYDPENPVPTLGGCNLFGCPAGPFDQRKAEKRDDVLVYTSEEMKEEVEVTGPVTVILYAASSAPDTDWTAKLVDVHPDGRAINLCDGVIRARYRDISENPSLIEPGDIYCYEIDLWVTSNVFLPGHRIRVEISSSNFPRFNRNPNTGHPFASDAELQKANQTIYHDMEHPSHIRLPIIPG